MRKILLFAIILLLAASLCGCTTVSVERKMNRDSSIEDIITVSFDEATLTEYGYSVDYAVTIIESLMTSNGYEVLSKDGCEVVGRKYYATHKEFEDAMPESESSLPTEDGFLFDIYTTESNTPFSATISSGFVDKIRDAYFSNIEQTMSKNITYVYKYSTPYSNIETNGTLTEGDLYTHTWTWNANEVEVAQIVVTQTIPDQTGWYLISLCAVAVIVAAGLIIIGFWKSKKGEEENG